MADIQFNCPSCTKSLVIDAKGTGLMVKCPDCGASVQVPKESTQTAPGGNAGTSETEHVGENPRPTVQRTQDTSCPKCGAERTGVVPICRQCLYDYDSGLTYRERQQRERDALSPPIPPPALRLKRSSPSAPRPSPPATPSHFTPSPPAREPSRQQVAFVCPHCGINIRAVAYPGESLQCLTCGGYVIAPEPAKPSCIVILGGGFLLVCFAIIAVGWFLGLTGSSSKNENGATASETQVSGVYALGAGDARSTYDMSDMESALQASKISRRIQSDPEYERGFRGQWQYLDNKASLDYQRAKGQ